MLGSVGTPLVLRRHRGDRMDNNGGCRIPNRIDETFISVRNGFFNNWVVQRTGCSGDDGDGEIRRVRYSVCCERLDANNYVSPGLSHFNYYPIGLRRTNERIARKRRYHLECAICTRRRTPPTDRHVCFARKITSGLQRGVLYGPHLFGGSGDRVEHKYRAR